MRNLRIRTAPGVPQTQIVLPGFPMQQNVVSPQQSVKEKEGYDIDGLPMQASLWKQDRRGLDVQKKNLVYNNLNIVTEKYGGDIMAFQRSEDGKKFLTSLVDLEKGYFQSDLSKGIIEEQKKLYDKVRDETLSNEAMSSVAMNQRNQYLYFDDQGKIQADTYVNPSRAYMTMGDYLQQALVAGYKGGYPEMLPMVDTAPTGEFDKFLNTMVDRVRGSMQEFITSETKGGKETGYRFSQSSNDRAIRMLNAVVYDQLATNPKALREAKSQYYTATGGRYLEDKINPNTKKPYTDDEKFRMWVTGMAGERAELERTYNISIIDKPSEAQRTMEYLGGLSQMTFRSAMMDRQVVEELSGGRKAKVNMPIVKDGKFGIYDVQTPVARYATDYINRENARITTYDSKGNASYTQDAKSSPYIMGILDSMGNFLSRADMSKVAGEVRIKQITDEVVYLPRMQTNPVTGQDIGVADTGNGQIWRRVELIADREFMKNYPTLLASKFGQLELETPAFKSWLRGGLQEDYIKMYLGGDILDKDNPLSLSEPGGKGGDINKKQSIVWSVLIPDNITNAAPNIMSDNASKEVSEWVQALVGRGQQYNPWVENITNQYFKALKQFEVNGRR